MKADIVKENEEVKRKFNRSLFNRNKIVKSA